MTISTFKRSTTRWGTGRGPALRNRGRSGAARTRTPCSAMGATSSSSPATHDSGIGSVATGSRRGHRGSGPGTRRTCPCRVDRLASSQPTERRRGHPAGGRACFVAKRRAGSWRLPEGLRCRGPLSSPRQSTPNARGTAPGPGGRGPVRKPDGGWRHIGPRRILGRTRPPPPPPRLSVRRPRPVLVMLALGGACPRRSATPPPTPSPTPPCRPLPTSRPPTPDAAGPTFTMYKDRRGTLIGSRGVQDDTLSISYWNRPARPDPVAATGNDFRPVVLRSPARRPESPMTSRRA
jgi:hypothetical protein